MNKWFKNVSSVEELRKQYRELLKKYHPDNDGGSVEITQEINAEYDRIFADLSKENKSDDKSSAYDNKAENEAFKTILNQIININADIEIIGSWVWIHGGYEYRELLKSIGFKFAPKKKCWCWHFGDYRRRSKREISLEEIRQKYGSQKVNSKSKQFAIN
ncbi:J domain-containing protein [Schaedlerella arabinosiphila]|uniref:J domain-containing protein n=1 Tax=Schaedlerella arabinosiphila TaxID=2044587 RepID=UPI00255807BE|nr:J domain-containing protein [Schaedlerella arabinosiphila]